MKALTADVAEIHARGSERSRSRLHQLEQFNAAEKAAVAARESAKAAIAAGRSEEERQRETRSARRDRLLFGGISAVLGALALIDKF